MGALSPDIELGPLSGFLFILGLLGVIWIAIYVFPAVIASLLAVGVLLVVLAVGYYLLLNIDGWLRRTT